MKTASDRRKIDPNAFQTIPNISCFDANLIVLDPHVKHSFYQDLHIMSS